MYGTSLRCRPNPRTSSPRRRRLPDGDLDFDWSLLGPVALPAAMHCRSTKTVLPQTLVCFK